MTWTVELSSTAIRTLDAVPARILPAIIEFIYGPLAENPQRVGKALRGEFEGTYSARRGQYRVIYELSEEDRHVLVVRVASRSDAYRS